VQEEAMLDEGTAAEVERLARWLVDRGLATPAVLYLELHKPLAHLGSQALIAASPLVAPLLGLERTERWQNILAEPARYEALVQRIEALAGAGQG
jgi:aminoglycoside phosphotransferase